jgi:hypothetical protein
MINFKVKILKYVKETLGFLVEYTPDVTMSSICTPVTQNFVFHQLTEETTPEEIYKWLSDASPQQFWQDQIDAAAVPSDKFEELVGEERSYNIEDYIPPEDHGLVVDGLLITAEMEQEFRDIEMEAAIQRVLGRLSGERV